MKMFPQVESATGGLGGNLEKMGSLLQKVPVKKLKALSDGDFGDMSGQTERKLNCSKDTCPELYKRVNNTIGQPGIKNANYTMTVFRNLGKVMCGMSVDDLKMIPATKMLEDIAGHLISLACLSDKQERILAEKLKYRLGLFSGNPRTVVSQDIKKFGGLLKHFDTDDLDSLGKSVCGDISLELGSADLSNVKSDDLKKLSKYAQECVNNTKDELSSDDMTAMGDLACGLSTDRVDDIADDAMQDVVNNVQSKCAQFSTKERKTWADKSMKKLNVKKSKIADADEVTLTQLGTFVAELGSSDLDKISNDVMSSIGSDIVDEFKDKKEELEKRDQKGFGNDVKDTDRKDSDEKEKKVYERLITAFKDTSRRRRKRSVSSLSCDDMQLLGSGVTALTTSEIEAMADSDFLDCASFLGGYSTWSTDQLSSLLTVATRAGTFSTATGWSADQVTDAGIITQGLTYSEIESLTDLTLDAMSSIGQHEGWSETQLGSGFSRWLDLNKGNDASAVTSSELIALGHFACGATTSHIGSMSSTEYSFAASYIGALTSCTESQLEAFADLAETAFGSISSWDTSVVSTVGAVIGGLTSNEISTLTTSQIAAIDPTSIAQIPSTSFVGFTVDQISSFSVAQAQSTTSDQQSGLSTAKLDALVAAGGTVESSAVAIQTPLLVLLLAALLSIVFNF
ncbi:uncharacterized protein LOC123562303 [Mercenaria mercenaria]|uniref:uncharacterized protein LOC123562303 n=1 Tax=Mercenaria mercenaria TaxID=6596 RepID=UPI00234F0A0A|nr:uncharacterized protein LOC123562303 [Mercenaria mercenaria]